MRNWRCTRGWEVEKHICSPHSSDSSRHKEAGGRRSRGGRRRDGDSGDSAVTWQLAIARQTPDTADIDMHCGLTVMIKPKAHAGRCKGEKSRILITLQIIRFTIATHELK